MAKFGLAQPVRRVEDPRLLRGAGAYTDDIRLPGTLLSPVVRSPHAAAKILAIDTKPAAATPGVIAVYTVCRPQGRRHRRPALRGPPDQPRRLEAGPPAPSGAGRRRGAPCRRPGRLHRGRDPQAARDGAEAVLVDYDTLPSVTDLATAHGRGPAPGVGGGPQRLLRLGDRPEGSDRRAVRRRRARQPSDRGEQPLVVTSMEARAALAEYDAATKRWTLRTNTQGGWRIKQMLGESIFKTGADRSA